ncbi:hypothetical protein [Microbispora bryophytorum]|uniref:hypothetical protein n=1 Tax=Microbispora bryophytorum TaxID=1460882 RepID=UPI003410CE9D
MRSAQDPRARADDSRFTSGLIYDITKVLKQHGYQLPSDERHNQALDPSVGVLLELVETYEGRRDVLGNKIA